MQMRMVLLDRFPACFKPFGVLKSPFKVGIAEDIFRTAPELDRKVVRWAVQNYTDGSTYQRAAAVIGTPRLDLQGQPAGEISESQASYHTRKFIKIMQKKLRREQERQRRLEAKAEQAAADGAGDT